MSAQITKEEWIARCAKRYTDVTGLPAIDAQEAAQVNYAELVEHGLDTTPEDAADDDIFSWGGSA